ncbi:MAG: aspartyl protease family protein [Planctomycetes bacterium]|nr:aspartyl protease family protein [Planctomycetota bacterium]
MRSCRWRSTPYLLLVAACAYSNAGILEDLEARARGSPDPALDRVIEREELPPLLGPARAVALPMLRAKVPAVMGRINGVEMPLVLDTGTSAVVLTAEAARDAGIYLPPGEPAAVVGPGHTGRNRIGAFATVELGGNRIGAGIALVPVDDRPGRWMELGADRYAIVGCTVLSHFRVTFDFRKAEVRLAPTGLAASAGPLFTETLVNGRPLLLLVDSGATAVFLEPWAAVDLGLITEGRAKRHEERATSLSGARFTHFTLDRVEVAGRTFREIDAAAVDTFGPWSSPGFRPGGLLGLKGLGDLVWTLDYGTRTLRLEP